MKLKTILVALAATACFTSAFAQSPIVIKFSHVVATDTPKGQAAARFKQLAETEAIDAGIVRDGRQFLHAGIAQREDQCLGNAAQAEAADGDGLAILHDAGQGGRRVRIYFVHCAPFHF